MRTITPQAGVNIQDLNRMDMYGHLYRVSEKIDGVRRIFYKDKHGMVHAFSKTARLDPWIDHICLFFEKNRFPCNTYYDCELVDRESYFNKVKSFDLRINTNSKAAQEYEDNKKDLLAICFDYYQPDSNDNTIKRTTVLQNIFMYYSLEDPVILVPILGNVKGENTFLINKLADQVIMRNGEGIMLQDCDLPYIPGRSKHLIKVKRKEDFIGTIVSVEMAMENTKIAGGARAVLCKVDGCSSIVRVGSGFTDEERFYIASYKDVLIGEEIEIEAFGISKDVKGNTSLSMPIFKQFVNGKNTETIHHFSRKEGEDY